MRRSVLSLFLFSSLALAAGVSDAAELKVDVSGNLASEYVFMNITDPIKYKVPSAMTAPLSVTNLSSTARLNFGVSGSMNSLDYGSNIEVKADTSGSVVGKQYSIYLSRKGLGKVEFGTNYGASGLRVTYVPSIDYVGGVEGDYKDYIPELTAKDMKLSERVTEYAALPIDNIGNSVLNRVSIYPHIPCKSMEVGISYAQDMHSSGSIVNEKSINKRSDQEGYKDIYDVIVKKSFDYKGLNLRTSLLWQHATSKPDSSNVRSLKNVNAYEIAFAGSTSGWYFGGTYGNWGDSDTAAVKKPGAKYGQSYHALAFGRHFTDKLQGAVSWFSSRKASGVDTSSTFTLVHDTEYNKYSAIGLTEEYTIADGLYGFAEQIRFDYKINSSTPAEHEHGIVFLTGIRVRF